MSSNKKIHTIAPTPPLDPPPEHAQKTKTLDSREAKNGARTQPLLPGVLLLVRQPTRHRNIVGVKQVGMQELYARRALKKARQILHDESHVLVQCNELLPSGRRFRNSMVKARAQRSFINSYIQYRSDFWYNFVTVFHFAVMIGVTCAFVLM